MSLFTHAAYWGGIELQITNGIAFSLCLRLQQHLLVCLGLSINMGLYRCYRQCICQRQYFSLESLTCICVIYLLTSSVNRNQYVVIYEYLSQHNVAHKCGYFQGPTSIVYDVMQNSTNAFERIAVDIVISSNVTVADDLHKLVSTLTAT